MDDKMTSLKALCSTFDTLVECFKAEVSTKGIEKLDTKEAGEVADIIKDLAEAKKSCWEACY